MKHDWKPGTMINPLPAVMVSCGNEPSEYNIITVAWVGTICTNPPMCYISVRPERFSYPILRKNMEFVINLTNRDLAYATDWCGVNSGKDHHKFEEMGLTPGRKNNWPKTLSRWWLRSARRSTRSRPTTNISTRKQVPSTCEKPIC